MSEQPFFFGNQDQLKLIISECIEQGLIDHFKKVPYSGTLSQDDELLTKQAAAKFLGVSEPTLIKHIKSGRLTHGYTGRKYIFKKSDLVKYFFKNGTKNK